jgi:hypothetical protein
MKKIFLTNICELRGTHQNSGHSHYNSGHPHQNNILTMIDRLV